MMNVKRRPRGASMRAHREAWVHRPQITKTQAQKGETWLNKLSRCQELAGGGAYHQAAAPSQEQTKQDLSKAKPALQKRPLHLPGKLESTQESPAPVALAQHLRGGKRRRAAWCHWHRYPLPSLGSKHHTLATPCLLSLPGLPRGAREEPRLNPGAVFAY